MSHNKIKISSPATIANLGPGFDSIGAAIDVWNDFEFEFDTDSLKIVANGEGTSIIPTDSSNLVYRAFSIPFKKLGLQIPNINLKINNNIKLEGGLGSSSSAISAGLFAANYYLKDQYSKLDLIKLSQELEKHYDNISPCIMGGIKICVPNENEVLLSNVDYDNNLKIILIMPNFSINTSKSRSFLPESISSLDFVYNMSRFGLLIKNLKSPDIIESQIAFQDIFHQDKRLENQPKLRYLLKKINSIGALGAFLCGSGPTIGGITNKDPMSIFYEIADYCDKQAIICDFLITSFTNKGTFIKN
jgi:homoserine kinase